MRPTSPLGDTLEKKAKAHEAAESCRQRDQHRVASLARLPIVRSECLYHEFAETLYAVPLPRAVRGRSRHVQVGVGRAVRRSARREGEGQLQAGHLDGHQLGVYSEWSAKSGQMAAKLTPQDFPIESESMVASDHTKDTLLSTSFIRSLTRGDTEVDFVTFEGRTSSRTRRTTTERRRTTRAGEGQGPGLLLRAGEVR